MTRRMGCSSWIRRLAGYPKSLMSSRLAEDISNNKIVSNSVKYITYLNHLRCNFCGMALVVAYLFGVTLIKDPLEA